MNNKETYFTKVYVENKDKIYRLCLGFMGNTFDAEDLQQEVLIQVWKNLDSFQGKSSIATWIYRIATNTAILYAKRRTKREIKYPPLKPNDEGVASVSSDATSREKEINKLYTAISSLKEIDRIVIGLLLEKNSYHEISEITGLTPTNVGVRISRIKKTLNKKLTS